MIKRRLLAQLVVLFPCILEVRELNLARCSPGSTDTSKGCRSVSLNLFLEQVLHRNRQMHFHKKIFSKADVIVTPTTGVTAYEIKDDALKTGELDYINGAALVRYQIAGNFLGLPAITVPIAYDEAGLPIGLQFIGRPWAEATLIQIAFAVQAMCSTVTRQPAVFYDLLSSK